MSNFNSNKENSSHHDCNTNSNNNNNNHNHHYHHHNVNSSSSSSSNNLNKRKNKRYSLSKHSHFQQQQQQQSPSQIETPPASPNASDHQNNSKACCFCWCCCCSCSCLTLKHDDSKNFNSIDLRIASNIIPPTSEEIRAWSETFEKLMQSQSGRFYFREFLRSEYSEENMLFWMACEELKSELSPEAIEEKARVVYEDYISILSPREVSLDSRVREIINRNMVDPNKHTFDEAQLQIYTLMHRDSYPRFLNSRLYRKLCESENKSV